MDLGQRNDMLELMEDRHGIKSTLITRQLPVKDWHAEIGDATLSGLILDRLVHNSHRIVLKGKSMRSMDPLAQGLNSPSPSPANIECICHEGVVDAQLKSDLCEIDQAYL